MSNCMSKLVPGSLINHLSSIIIYTYLSTITYSIIYLFRPFMLGQNRLFIWACEKVKVFDYFLWIFTHIFIIHHINY